MASFCDNQQLSNASMPSETSRLLVTPTPGPPQTITKWSRIRQNLFEHWDIWGVVWLISIFIFIIDFGENLRIIPELRLLESALCRRYYLEHDNSLVDHNGDVDEKYCKIDVLQAELMMLRGWLSLMRGVTQIVFVLPYGVLADSKGRRLTIALSELGLLLSSIWTMVVCFYDELFPVEAVWASTLFLIIGGGSPVLNSVAMAMVADAVTPEKRTSAFFYVSTTNLMVELLAPPLGAWLMTVASVYNTLIIGFTIEFCGFLTLLAVPETLRMKPTENGLMSVTNPETEGTTDNLDETTSIYARKGVTEWCSNCFQDVKISIKNILKLILADRHILLSLPAFLVNRLSRQVMAVLLQYIPKVLGWTLASTSYLLSVRPAINIILFPVGIPVLHKFLIHKKSNSNSKANLLLARWSCAALVGGCLILGASRSVMLITIGIVVFSLGWGFNNCVQLFVTSRVDKNQVALIYTAFSVMDAIGALAGSPMLAVSFSAGLKMEGLFFGLPLLVAGALFAFASSGIWVLTA